jgi:hypothetical protein
MKNVTLSITATEQRPMPPDTERAFAGFRFRLTAASGASAASDITQETVWTFGGAKAGVYQASVVPVDQAGEPLMAEVSIEVVVTDAPAARTYPAPLGLSYVLSDVAVGL